ncbi:MAG: glutamate--tRNA ligase [Chloroflexi bacterium]|nr:glutamate--tRNA ligase [Chloroflexota bacterium]
MTVRVRYAPSPTGLPHVGNIRTALFNWLFARNKGGVFIVRIEDTDQTRKVEGAAESILEALRWLGLDWDEGPEVGGPYGPYFQSERLHIYQPVAAQLVKEGQAYYCSCTPERLEAVRTTQARQGQPPKYDRHCRDKGLPAQVEGRAAVVRFKTPPSGQTMVHDLIRGDVTFAHDTLDDFVMLKSDGYPTYHLANVVDDHLMDVTHVLRAEEWLPSTPRHMLLYQALGWKHPQFAHLPMLLGSDRSKLSKRHGATALLEYRDQGYLPEAMMNFLALLGWSLDDKTEIISREDLIRHFSLERVGKAGAIFDLTKLSWMNSVYIRALPPEELARRVAPFLERALPPQVKRPIDLDYVRRIMPLEQERFKTLGKVPGLTEFFFLDALHYDPKTLIGKGMDHTKAQAALQQTLQLCRDLPQFDAAGLETAFRNLAAALGVSTGQLFGAIRVATTGRTAAPPLFQTMEALGRERCVQRLEQALRLLG